MLPFSSVYFSTGSDINFVVKSSSYQIHTKTNPAWVPVKLIHECCLISTCHTCEFLCAWSGNVFVPNEMSVIYTGCGKFCLILGGCGSPFLKEFLLTVLSALFPASRNLLALSFTWMLVKGRDLWACAATPCNKLSPNSSVTLTVQKPFLLPFSLFLKHIHHFGVLSAFFAPFCLFLQSSCNGMIIYFQYFPQLCRKKLLIHIVIQSLC